MNAPQPTQLEVYRAEVLPPHKATELFKSLPGHIKPAVFERNLLNALTANPDLMQFHPGLVYREVAKAAGLGLLLDPLLGEAYIVVAYNYKTRRKEPQLRVGYKGMIKLARQTGNVATISCHEVHAHDEVEVDLGFPKVFHHRPHLFAERGPIMGYVALIAFKDGTFDFEPMSVAQCQAIRDRSDAWKAYSGGMIKSTPWATDESEMSKKTTLRRLLKRQEASPEMVRAYQIEDEAEFEETRPIAPVAHQIDAPPAPPANDDAPPVPAEETPSGGAVENNEPPPPADDPPAPAEEAVVETSTERLPAGTVMGDVVNLVIPDDLGIPEFLRADVTANIKAGVAELVFSDEERDWFEELENAFSACESIEQIAEQQAKRMTPYEGSVPTQAWNRATEIVEHHIERIQTAE